MIAPYVRTMVFTEQGISMQDNGQWTYSIIQMTQCVQEVVTPSVNRIRRRQAALQLLYKMSLLLGHTV